MVWSYHNRSMRHKGPATEATEISGTTRTSKRASESCQIRLAEISHAPYTNRTRSAIRIMTVTFKIKEPLVVPPAIRRKAGFKSGQELEFKASGGVVTIVPKPSPDELQDRREVRDPKISGAIRKGYEEFLAGKTRPIQEFLAERASRARKAARRRPGA